MKSIIKTATKLIGRLIYILLNNTIGRFILDEIIYNIINNKKSIFIDNEKVYLSTPNRLLHFRKETFYTKEEDTLTWIDSFKKNSIFLDVGANVGLYSIYAAKKRDTITYAIEPSFFNLEFLVRNIFINKLNNKINVLPIALNNDVSISNFHLTTTEWGGALSTFDKTFDDSGNKINQVFKYKTLGFDIDTLFDLLKINKIDYLKIDVDGLEHIILLGLKKLLPNIKEILIEINDDFKEQKKKSSQILSKYGFYLDQKVYLDAGSKKVANQIWKKIK